MDPGRLLKACNWFAMQKDRIISIQNYLLLGEQSNVDNMTNFENMSQDAYELVLFRKWCICESYIGARAEGRIECRTGIGRPPALFPFPSPVEVISPNVYQQKVEDAHENARKMADLIGNMAKEMMGSERRVEELENMRAECQELSERLVTESVVEVLGEEEAKYAEEAYRDLVQFRQENPYKSEENPTQDELLEDDFIRTKRERDEENAPYN